MPLSRTNRVLNALKTSDILDVFSLTKLASCLVSFGGSLASPLPRPFPVVRTEPVLAAEVLASPRS